MSSEGRPETANTRRRYDRVAPYYDALEICTEFGYRRWRRDLWARVPKGLVLEVGVGTGKNMRWYPDRARVTAIDISEAMLEQARRRAERLGTPVDLHLADAQALPWRDGTFDAVVATFVFCSVPDAVQGLRECRRVLVPGAPVLLLEHVQSGIPGLRTLLRWLDPLTTRLGGFHVARDTTENMRLAGLAQVREQRLLLDVFRRIEARAPERGNRRPRLPR